MKDIEIRSQAFPRTAENEMSEAKLKQNRQGEPQKSHTDERFHMLGINPREQISDENDQERSGEDADLACVKVTDVGDKKKSSEGLRG